MGSRYSIYFAGQLLDGHEPGAVRARLAKLFNADQATLDKLFSGKAQLIKRDCDKPTALKYKQAMEKAGARPVVKLVDAPAGGQAPAQQSAVDKIAALANAPDLGRYRGAPQEAGKTTAEPPASATTAGDQETFDLAPAGADVLRPGERREVVEQEVDTAGLELDEAGQRLAAEAPAPPPAPDTSHLSAAAAGESIPNLPSDVEPLAPDVSGLDLSPAGTDFSDCVGPEAEVPELDLSGIDLAPPGTEVLEQQYRKQAQGQAPATDHLSLED